MQCGKALTANLIKRHFHVLFPLTAR
jgi:hypothetical protein